MTDQPDYPRLERTIRSILTDLRGGVIGVRVAVLQIDLAVGELTGRGYEIEGCIPVDPGDPDRNRALVRHVATLGEDDGR